jgi:hypothetical protein
MTKILYTTIEKKVIADAKVMGYNNHKIAKLVNKKIHHNVAVRTAEGVRKIK